MFFVVIDEDGETVRGHTEAESAEAAAASLGVRFCSSYTGDDGALWIEVIPDVPVDEDDPQPPPGFFLRASLPFTRQNVEERIREWTERGR